MCRVPLERPPRPPAGAVTDVVRGAILRRLHDDLGLRAPNVLALHTQAEFIPDTEGLLEDLERRYQLPVGSIEAAVARRIAARETQTGFAIETGFGPKVFSEMGAGLVLLEIPETEFLTAIQHAVDELERYDRADDAMIEGFFRYADGALAAHGAPYRRIAGQWRFEWIGDPQQHELTVQPALQALADPRLAGAQDEFEDALLNRRRGTPKELEGAIGKAASAVESTLKILHNEHNIPLPKSGELGSLFGRLSSNDLEPVPITG